MRKLLFLCAAIGVSEITPVFSQAPTLVSVTPPSPNVQAMQKYGDIPVSAYTGVPDISIPIYTAKFRDLSIPITISYHASGIKVAEEASEVGLGWVLNAGGAISRNVIGADDFSAGASYFTNSIIDMDSGTGPTNKVQRGCNLQMFSTTGQNTIFNYNVSNDLINGYDFQPDQYYYNFPGHSGKFVMTRSFEAILQKQETISITCQSPTGASWEIKSMDGYIYDFALQETYTAPGSGTPHICAWYLTKITSPTGNVATFNYTANPSTVSQGIGGYTELRDDYQLSLGAPGEPADGQYPAQRGLVTPNVYSNQLLTSIDMPNCRIQFYFSNGRTDLTGDQRLDSVSVFTKDKSGNVAATPLKTTALSYGYFNYGDVDDDAFGGTGGTIYYQRMKLTQLQNTGYYGGVVNRENPYVFTYYEGGLYWSMTSKGSFARDHWGYYNGKTGNTSLIPSFTSVATSEVIAFALKLQGPERDPDTGYVKAFSLQSIQYPTGGATTFQYESNDFDEYNSEVNDNTYFSRQPDVIPATKTFTYDAWAHQMEGSDDTLNLDNEYYQPVFGTVPQISMNAAFRFSTSAGTCDTMPRPMHAMYFAICDSTGAELQEYDLASYSACSGGNTNGCYICGSGVFTINQTLTLNPGKYVFKAYNQGVTAPSQLETIMVTFNYTVVEQPQPTAINVNPDGTYFDMGGGLRIKRIIDQEPLNPANNKVRKYIYHYFADRAGTGTPQEFSYGRRMAKPEYSYFSVDQVRYSFKTGLGCSGYQPYYTLHLLRTSDSYNPLNGSAGGSVVGYDQVTELLGENGEYGEKVYRYNNLPDLVFNYPEPASGNGLPMRPPYGSNIPNALNGTLLGETDYTNLNGKFIKVKDVSNTYETVLASQNYLYGLYNVMLNTSNTGDDCDPQISSICDTNSLTYSYVAMPSQWQRIANSDEKDYNQGDTTNYVDQYTQYIYDNPVHKLVTRTVTADSKGEKNTSATQYPLDFSNPTGADAFSKGVANLQNSHVIDRPVEKHVDIVNSDGSRQRTTHSYLAYFNAHSPTESALYRIEKASPVTNFTPASTSSSGLSSSPYYQPYIYFDQYDANGNILQQHKENDFPHSYIWDYASSLLVAEVSNAAQADIAYTSFEADGTGNWTVPSTVTDGTTAITGSQSYNLSNGAISKGGLTVGKIYVISYWSRNGSYTITGGTYTTRTGRYFNGWTYYEHIVTAGSGTLSVGGTGNIDELRLFPQGAVMTDYTYAPLVGVTTQADAGDRINYYGYDGLGRLQWIKDLNGNIVKTFSYHYPNN